MIRYGNWEYNWDGTDIREINDELKEWVHCEYEDALYDEFQEMQLDDSWIEEDEE